MNNIIPMQLKRKSCAEKIRHWLEEKNKPAPKKPMATRVRRVQVDDRDPTPPGAA